MCLDAKLPSQAFPLVGKLCFCSGIFLRARAPPRTRCLTEAELGVFWCPREAGLSDQRAGIVSEELAVWFLGHQAA